MENHRSTDLYACPMHPEMKQERPGRCPECGMSLIPAKKQHNGDHPHGEGVGAEHDKHAGHSTNIFKTKFWVSLALSIPIVLYSDIVRVLFSWQLPVFPGSEYIPFVLASVVFLYGGSVFLISASRELRAKLPGMMTLISLAITTAYAYSVYAVLAGQGETLFWELATLITIMLLGHWLEMRAVRGAQGALKELSKLLPDMAEIIQGEHTRLVPLSELREGDRVLVKPGAKVPADGEVANGNSYVDESLVTGESKPVAKLPGSQVIAGTVNGDGALKVRITKIGAHTFLAGVMRLVEEAQTSKSRLQMLSDRAAFYLTLVAVIAGGLTLTGWLTAGSGLAFAVERLVAVLVIACPHALGLAVPLVASISTTKAAQNGFLVRRRLALEAARDIDIVLFDKTGTLTEGEFGVSEIIAGAESSEGEVLCLAASVNSHSEHPLAKAMIEEAKKRGLAISEAKQYQRIPGKGAQAEIEGKEITVGSLRLAEERGARFSGELERKTKLLSKQGKTINVVMRGNALLGIMALTDVIRQESREAIRMLRSMDVETAMITGDSEDVARWVAGELDIREYFAKVLPHEKSEKVKFLQSKGAIVAMVGDGVNDAPALTQADLGIAIGAGTNVAIESAGIILVRNDPRDIVKIIRLSRITYRKMMQNLFWATGYNVVALPLAAGVLASRGIILQPALAAIFMSASTVIVAINAMLLRKQEI